MSKLSKTDKDEVKTIKSEIKADKAAIKDDKEVVINEETGRPLGLDEDGTIHAPKLGSKLGQVEGEVVAAANRKDSKSKTAVAVEAPADVDPTAVSVPMTYHANSKSAKVGRELLDASSVSPITSLTANSLSFLPISFLTFAERKGHH